MAYTLLETRITKYAGSGTSTPDGLDYRAFIRTYYEQTDEDKNLNQSKIKIEIGTTNGQNGTYSQYKLTGKVNNTTRASYNSGPGTISGTSVVRASATNIIIPHNEDGTGKVTVSLTLNDILSFNTTRGLTYTYTLPTIIRGTLISNNTSSSSRKEFGASVTFTLNSLNQGLSYLYFYDASNTLHNITSTSGTSSTSIPYTFDLNLLNTYTTSAEQNITVYCKNLTNNVISQSIVYLVAPSSVKPSVAIGIQDLNTTASGWGVIVQGKSRLRVTLTPTISYSSPITNYLTTVNGTQYSGQTFDTDVIKTETSINTSVTDARNRTGSATKQINSTSSPKYLTYSSPNMTNVQVVRCDANGNEMSSGTYAKIKVSNYAISSCDNHNTKTLSVKVGTTTKTITLNNYTESSFIPSKSQYQGSSFFSGILQTNSYLCEFTISDSFETKKYTYTMPPAFELVSKRAGGKGLSLGEVATLDDLRVHMDTYFYNKVCNLFPIGYIYMSVNNTNPSTYFGGTWTPINNTFLVASGSSFAPGSSGGQSTHSHSLSSNGYAKLNMSNTGSYLYADMNVNQSFSDNYYMRTNGNRTAVSGDTTTGVINLGGSTDSASNLPPYLAVYMWERTA